MLSTTQNKVRQGFVNVPGIGARSQQQPKACDTGDETQVMVHRRGTGRQGREGGCEKEEKELEYTQLRNDFLAICKSSACIQVVNCVN